MGDIIEIMLNAIRENGLDDAVTEDIQAALNALSEAGYAVVSRVCTPKMAEVGLFANNDALLMSASSGDVMNAWEAMIQAAETK